MLQQDLDAHQHQHHAAEQLRPGLVLRAENIAHLQTDGGQHKGDHADEQHRRHNLHLQEGKGHAHGQRVDAGGDGQGQHGSEGEGIVQLLLLALEGLADHVAADDPQQHKGDPVIHAGDQRLKLPSQHIADGGHQRLEAAEVRTHNQRMPGLRLAHGKPLADRHRKGVHAQPHRNEKQFNQAHENPPVVWGRDEKTRPIRRFPPWIIWGKNQISLVAMYKARGMPQYVDFIPRFRADYSLTVVTLPQLRGVSQG